MSQQEDGAALDDGEDPSHTVVGYFRDQPARFFGGLGAFAFVGGWAGVIYLAFFSDLPGGTSFDNFQRVQVLVSLGATVTIASGILWGIAAYIWIHLLPEQPETPERA